MDELLKDKLRLTHPRLGGELTELLKWLEMLGPNGYVKHIPAELTNSGTHQLLVGTQSRHVDNENTGSWKYFDFDQTMVRIGAVVLSRESYNERGGSPRGEWERRWCKESVFVAVPADVPIVTRHEAPENNKFFSIDKGKLTDVVNTQGPWWDILRKEAPRYLAIKRKWDEAERERLAHDQRKAQEAQAERVRAAAAAVNVPRPLSPLPTASTRTPVKSTRVADTQSGCATVLFLIVTIGSLLLIRGI